MTRPIVRILVAILAFSVASSDAFLQPPTTAALQHRKTAIYPARMVPGAQNVAWAKKFAPIHATVALKMSSSEGGDKAEESKAVISADGTFYDDEVSGSYCWLNGARIFFLVLVGTARPFSHKLCVFS